MLEETPYSQYSSYITSLTTVMNQGVSNNEYVASQYDVLWGDVNNFGASNPHGVVVVLNKSKELSDLLLAQLGYFTEDEFYNMIFKAAPQDLPGEYNEALDRSKYYYEEIANRKFYWYPNDDVYEDQSMMMSGTFVHRYKYNAEAKKEAWADDAVELSVAAIVMPKENVSYGSLQSGFIYSEEFAREMVSKNINSHIAQNIREHGNISSVEFTNIPIGINYKLGYTYYDTADKYYKESEKTIYVGKNQSGIMSTFMSYIGQGSGISMGQGSSSSGSGNENDLSDMLSKLKTMDLNGVAGTYIPESIAIYPNDFDTKHLVTDYLDKWNNDGDVTFNVFNEDFTQVFGETTLTKDQRTKIKYTDSVELIINIINTMIDIVTYALVGFTALSLVVSTVMIAIITYVSVMERVKEIGVIRSLGGRKKDVSHLFNAEAFILGLTSGVFGIIITYIMQLFGNIIVNLASGGTVRRIANLTPLTAVIMILVSIVLTTISGVMPARSAAKKDPVVALRTE